MTQDNLISKSVNNGSKRINTGASEENSSRFFGVVFLIWLAGRSPLCDQWTQQGTRADANGPRRLFCFEVYAMILRPNHLFTVNIILGWVQWIMARKRCCLRKWWRSYFQRLTESQVTRQSWSCQYMTAVSRYMKVIYMYLEKDSMGNANDATCMVSGPSVRWPKPPSRIFDSPVRLWALREKFTSKTDIH